MGLIRTKMGLIDKIHQRFIKIRHNQSKCQSREGEQKRTTKSNVKTMLIILN